MNEEALEKEFGFKGQRLKVAVSAVEFFEQWKDQNPGNNDKNECFDFVQKNIKSKYKGIISSLLLAIFINVVVKVIVDRLFKDRSNLIEQEVLEEEVVEEAEVEEAEVEEAEVEEAEVEEEITYFDNKYLELEE